LFGYVRICKPRLTCGDYELYRGAYCSLCKTLGRRYGPFARLTLNYDMTFYALLALSAGEEEPVFTPGRCSYNPAKRCLRCRCPALDCAADVSMLLAYYQWRDKLEDGSFWERLLWVLPGLFFLRAGRKAAKRAPRADRIIRTAVSAQRLVEHETGQVSLDRTAHPSAHALGALCALLDARLYRLGYLLGRWVYLVDAADDYAGDVKRGRFNAFKHCESDPWEALAATAAELERAWGELGLMRYGAIFENIVTLGLAGVEQAVRERRAVPPIIDEASAQAEFGDIRHQLQAARYDETLSLLDDVPPHLRTAEWYYLKGRAQKGLGRPEEAEAHFAKASYMAPKNSQYRAARDYMREDRSETDCSEKSNGSGSCDCVDCVDSCFSCLCGLC